MRCPRCGNPLVLIERDPQAEIAPAMDKWYESDMSTEPPEPDESEHLECHHDGCVFRGTHFNKHHPFKGTRSKPGDSWSLSWIK